MSWTSAIHWQLCTKLYLDSFRFDIFIARCLGGYFFPDTVIGKAIAKNSDIGYVRIIAKMRMQCYF